MESYAKARVSLLTTDCPADQWTLIKRTSYEYFSFGTFVENLADSNMDVYRASLLHVAPTAV